MLQEKILNLLKAPQSRYDVDHALVLCKTYRFQRGVLFLYEKLKLYHEILQHHMERGENAKVRGEHVEHFVAICVSRVVVG